MDQVATHLEKLKELILAGKVDYRQSTRTGDHRVAGCFFDLKISGYGKDFIYSHVGDFQFNIYRTVYYDDRDEYKMTPENTQRFDAIYQLLFRVPDPVFTPKQTNKIAHEYLEKTLELARDQKLTRRFLWLTMTGEPPADFPEDATSDTKKFTYADGDIDVELYVPQNLCYVRFRKGTTSATIDTDRIVFNGTSVEADHKTQNLFRLVAKSLE